MRRLLPSAVLVVALAAGCANSAPVGPRAPTSAPAAPGSAMETGTTASSTAPTGPTRLELARADVPRGASSKADAASAASAINAFAFNVYRAMAVDDGNIVFSPTSIGIALGMARAGARGETATQMDRVLHEVATDDHANWLNSLDQALAKRSGTFEDGTRAAHQLSLEIANAYFAQRDYRFEPAFLEALAARFGAGVNLVDYLHDPEAARQQINQWTREQTRDRIPELVPEGAITPATRLALVNAIYLKAPWQYPFDATATEDRPFTRPDGSTVSVPMMRSTLGISCATGRGWEAIGLPYVGNTLSMLVIVPDDLGSFEATVDEELITAIDGVVTERVDPDVSLPRFDFETKADLVTLLDELGMPDAFDSARADFSAITSEERLWIDHVIHQANISIDEKGTEAAAATVVSFPASGPPPDKCVASADRPFVFAIVDRETRAMLFLGRVVDPS